MSKPYIADIGHVSDDWPTWVKKVGPGIYYVSYDKGVSWEALPADSMGAAKYDCALSDSLAIWNQFEKKTKT